MKFLHLIIVILITVMLSIMLKLCQNHLADYVHQFRNLYRFGNMLIHSCLFGFHFMTGRLSASDTLPVLPHPINAVINIRSVRTPESNFFIFIYKSILFHMPLLKKLPAPHPVYQNRWQKANINTLTTILLLTLLSRYLFI